MTNREMWESLSKDRCFVKKGSKCVMRLYPFAFLPSRHKAWLSLSVVLQETGENTTWDDLPTGDTHASVSTSPLLQRHGSPAKGDTDKESCPKLSSASRWAIALTLGAPLASRRAAVIVECSRHCT